MTTEGSTTALRLRLADAPAAMGGVISAIAAAGGTLRTLATPRVADDVAEIEIEVADGVTVAAPSPVAASRRGPSLPLAAEGAAVAGGVAVGTT